MYTLSFNQHFRTYIWLALLMAGSVKNIFRALEQPFQKSFNKTTQFHCSLYLSALLYCRIGSMC